MCIRDSRHPLPHEHPCVGDWVCLEKQPGDDFGMIHALLERCLLYTSDAADDLLCVDLGGRRTRKKKNMYATTVEPARLHTPVICNQLLELSLLLCLTT